MINDQSLMINNLYDYLYFCIFLIINSSAKVVKIFVSQKKKFTFFKWSNYVHFVNLLMR